MSHSVSEAAARAVKNSERKRSEETRTPDQRLADIRKNRAAKLFVTPDDQDFLLASVDAALASAASYDKDLTIMRDETKQLVLMLEKANQALESTRADRENLAREVITLQGKIEEFRQVYEQENRSMEFKVERTASEAATDLASNY